MLTFIIGILTVLSSIASEIDSISPKSRIILNTNYGSVMSEDEYNRMKQERQVRSIDITSDTIKVSIYGPSIRIPDLSEYKKCYTADIQINNKKNRFIAKKNRHITHLKQHNTTSLTVASI